ncbi:expressed protein [Chlorella variabilis]|uniref:Expressed protein n=1 Tax=Chlorella variabilis TaxID=554065 RepID=E1Z7G8_CHLVA|nr:expressed protein [Chlorella variabilis]EFN58167.1 expressed protein [Chlorella variabilis]|eukprot:XP_005850269.1 expressed protein [Chlorella variabilis]
MICSGGLRCRGLSVMHPSPAGQAQATPERQQQKQPAATRQTCEARGVPSGELGEPALAGLP